MESMYLLVPLSVVLVFVIALIFWWSLRSGQYDDLEGPAYRVVMDDDAVRTPAALNLTENFTARDAALKQVSTQSKVR